MNRVILSGRLTKVPETRYTNDNKAVSKFTLAVDDKFKDSTDYISCVTFGKVAEFVEKYLSKGIKIIVEGRWSTGSFDGKDGKKVYTNDCVVESIEFGEPKRSKASDESVNDTPPLEDGFEKAIQCELPFN